MLSVCTACRFIGADPSRLRPSSRFTKQAPDDLRTSVANFEVAGLAGLRAG